jgi:hypothetical protein
VSEAEDTPKPVLLDTQSGITTEHYRQAMGGEGPLAYTWEDKPHRLVFDLVRFIEHNRHNVVPFTDQDDGGIAHLTGEEMAGILGAIRRSPLSPAIAVPFTPLQYTDLKDRPDLFKTLAEPISRQVFVEKLLEVQREAAESHTDCDCEQCTEQF